MKVLTAILLVSLLFLSSNCKKDNTGNTTTPNPANSFSCYINGVYWEPFAKFTWGGPAALEVTFKPDIGYLNLSALKDKPSDSIFESINFFCENMFETKQYNLYTGNGELRGFSDAKNNYPCGPYFHDTANPGTLTITKFDKNKRYFVSTFELTLKNKSCGADSLMYITNGKFTYNY